MRGFLLALFIYPFVEIASLIMMAGHLGATFTLFWVIGSALLGILMLRNQQIGRLLTLGAVFKQGERLSLYSLLWPLRYVLAGVLFIIPGVISDVLAVVLLLPLKGPQIKMQETRFEGWQGPAQERNSDGDVIEGEFTSKNDPRDRLP